MAKRYRVRKDRTPEDTHVFRGVLGTILLIATIIGSIAWKFPPKDGYVSPVASAQIRGPK